MTDVLEAPEPVVSAPPRPARRRRRLLVLGLLALVATGVAIALSVLMPPLDAVDRTSVLIDARPFVCKDGADATTYTSTESGNDDDEVFVPAIRLHPGLDCTMAVVIRNDSDLDVSVDRITIPLAGASNGTGVHAGVGYVQSIHPAGGPDARDAVFDYEHDPHAGGSFPVGAHSTQRFSFHLSWSDGCMDDNSASIFTGAPTAVLSAGPWHVEQRYDGAGYAFVGGKHSAAATCAS